MKLKQTPQLSVDSACTILADIVDTFMAVSGVPEYTTILTSAKTNTESRHLLPNGVKLSIQCGPQAVGNLRETISGCTSPVSVLLLHE
jgi:hypothetical protein